MRERLDTLLVRLGHFPSRERAKAAIMAGVVYVNGQKSDKAGNLVDPDAEILVRENLCPYVSRGGWKLERSVEAFGLHLDGAVCMDIGASTGGFTDCMLQHGAAKVYAVDVGYGQLDWKLRNDPRVVNMEKCNVRYLDPAVIAEPMDFISIDVSFISLRLIFPVARAVLAAQGQMVCLVKPQFEAGREQVGKHGIVRDPQVHQAVIARVMDDARAQGLYPRGLTYSPVTGAKGNIEFLLHLSKQENLCYNVSCIQDVVGAAHAALAQSHQKGEQSK